MYIFYLSRHVTYCRQYLLCGLCLCSRGALTQCARHLSLPSTCGTDRWLLPKAWQSGSDHRLTLVVGTPCRIQGITACAFAYDPRQVVQLCFHHQFQWRPCKFYSHFTNVLVDKWQATVLSRKRWKTGDLPLWVPSGCCQATQSWIFRRCQLWLCGCFSHISLSISHWKR